MSDPHVDRWRQAGLIYVWKHLDPRDTHWSIMADDRGCASLLDLIERMEQAVWPGKKTILLRKAVVTQETYPGVRDRAAKHLTLHFQKDRVDDSHWTITESGGDVTIKMGRGRLEELKEAVADMRAGGYDYGIGADDARLWIWQYFRQPD